MAIETIFDGTFGGDERIATDVAHEILEKEPNFSEVFHAIEQSQ